MWASTQPIVFNNVVGPLSQAVQTGAQITRIDYGRPETWSFLFTARLDTSVLSGVGGGTLEIDFDLTLGLGRTAVEFPKFESFIFDLSQPGTFIYSGQVVSPKRTPIENTTNLIDRFPAQSINCVAHALLQLTGGSPTVTCSCSVNAYFAPRTHVRPEWYKDGSFRGDEQGGM